MNISYVLNQLSDRFFKLRVYDLSAQMAYYFLMSVFPFLLVIYSLMAYLPIKEDNILELVKPYAPENTYDLIDKTLSYTVTEQQGNILSFGLIITLWLSSMGFQCIKRILNDAYSVQLKGNFLKQILESLVLTVGFMIAILFSVFIPVIEKVMRHYLNAVFSIDGFQNLWILIQWGIGSLFLIIFFLVLYYFAPNIKLKLSKVWPGAIFSTIGWQLVSMGFAAYVRGSNYSALYGQLGGIVVLMLWFYLSAMIIIIGGLLNTIVHPARESN
ncbi:YihY/virulence factor BrkB family protein [Peribacillus cavernae]|uniref:YihY/virulence factor BrkB family protein n=1 Tax=Peribacillus cavernae TaxID=1674310 RepID=A0A433HRJ5_9BACI|nr:YihY/virulence factor BrkB family protein [Peribacillus cavernae]MDQ0218757.1 membrane protein [Peribacillus cavernae]RUQ30969.1 YihY/virulence factor BrkB family protein [Peribacillus cavernae]